MNKLTEQVLPTVRKVILDFMRGHEVSWAPDDYWWYGLQDLWSPPDFMQQGEPVRENELYRALIDLEVPREWIVKRGAYTYVELDNITFIFRTRHYKDGREPLEVAPHLKGHKFRQCGHSFIHPCGSAYDLAQHMIDLDRWIPEIKVAAKQAYCDGLQERKIRSIKHQTAGVFLRDYFQGDLPKNVVHYSISDSKPGLMDIIRLTIYEEGRPFWETQYFDIPFEAREMLEKDVVKDFIEDPRLRLGWMEMFVDEDTGDEVPVIRCTPFQPVMMEDGTDV